MGGDHRRTPTGKTRPLWAVWLGSERAKERVMQQLTRTATFTDDRIDDEALTTIVARSVLEAALAEDEKAQLWFELAGGDETRRLAIDLSATDLEEILSLSNDAD